ncbi:hypothetical protein GCM10010430_31220 [Kitasatospora cystarginea]|uniref:Transposase n=1 Tax=Kitasatospora cystarginea TaxID=58350 RepID=A0ABP5R1A7_9ACTN
MAAAAAKVARRRRDPAPPEGSKPVLAALSSRMVGSQSVYRKIRQVWVASGGLAVERSSPTDRRARRPQHVGHGARTIRGEGSAVTAVRRFRTASAPASDVPDGPALTVRRYIDLALGCGSRCRGACGPGAARRLGACCRGSGCR